MTTRECVSNRIIELCRERNMTINGLARLSALPPSTLKKHCERGQSESGYRDNQKALRRAGDHTDRVFRYTGVRGAGAGDPVTLPTILGFAGTIRHQETSYFRGRCPNFHMI